MWCKSCGLTTLRPRNSYLRHLEVLELLLPGEDSLQAANPHVDVANQHGLADPSDEHAQRGAQVVQEPFDEARVLLVVEHWGDRTQPRTHGYHRRGEDPVSHPVSDYRGPGRGIYNRSRSEGVLTPAAMGTDLEDTLPSDRSQPQDTFWESPYMRSLKESDSEGQEVAGGCPGLGRGGK